MLILSTDYQITYQQRVMNHVRVFKALPPLLSFSLTCCNYLGIKFHSQLSHYCKLQIKNYCLLDSEATLVMD